MTFPAASQVPSFKETFRQKKTQREYMARQIALLQTYLEALKKGYKIVSNGLYTIENIKNGDFNLSRDFFSSLKNVNPHIASSARVADITAFQVALLKELKRVNSFARANKNFSPLEVRYIAEVYSNMLKLSDASVSELLQIVRPNKSEMKDDERINRLNQLHDDMKDKYAFSRSFANDIRLLAFERERESFQQQTLSKTYNL